MTQDTRILDLLPDRGFDAGHPAAIGSVSAAPANRIMVTWGTSGPMQEAGLELIRDLSPEACDLSLLKSGRAPLLNAHGTDLDDLLGIIEEAWTESRDGIMYGHALCRMGRGPRAVRAFEDIQDGILTGASVGFRTVGVEPTADPQRFRVYRWRPYEISLCVFGKDPAAGIWRRTSNQSDLLTLAKARAAEAVQAERLRQLRAADWERWSADFGDALATMAGQPDAIRRALADGVRRHLEVLSEAAA